jgi:nanoRNase/pAp phosphatase (c-di-AMP/oligoRNAs hydrolase)
MEDFAARADALRTVLLSGKRLVVYLHDNPDPDTIASGWLLARLAEHLGRPSRVVYGGDLGRAENRTMVRLLRIPLNRLSRPTRRLRKADTYALVDTRPGAGNNSFPSKGRANIVIDHHPTSVRVEGDFVDIFDDAGACTTRVFSYFEALGGKLDSQLATAIVYAIISETQDLGREATPADIGIFHQVLPRAKLPVLGQIRHPSHDREYYRTIARAMGAALIGRHTCVCHIGPVPYPEVVAEVADLLVGMERISWCLVTGDTGKGTHLSIRATRPGARAEEVMKRILQGVGRGGGHGAVAGGSIPCTGVDCYSRMTEEMTERFMAELPFRKRERLSPLTRD